jgi:hypothetical protein
MEFGTEEWLCLALAEAKQSFAEVRSQMEFGTEDFQIVDLLSSTLDPRPSILSRHPPPFSTCTPIHRLIDS